MDFRKIFDTIPEEFDRWRPRYCPELFADLAEYGQLGPGKEVLEVGPGTGQATEPVLRTGCSYTAIELGEHLTEFMKKRFREYGNFRIVNGDFETYDFGEQKFDMVYSAAAFQWIPQEIGYPKAWELLKEGGAFAMFLMRPDARPGGGYTDEPLYSRIQQVYDRYFHPEVEYRCSLDYDARSRYGFTDLEYREYPFVREFDTESYLSYIATHSDHQTLREPDKSRFYQGIREAIDSCGGKMTMYNKFVLYLGRKASV